MGKTVKVKTASSPPGRHEAWQACILCTYYANVHSRVDETRTKQLSHARKLGSRAREEAIRHPSLFRPTFISVFILFSTSRREQPRVSHV